MASKYSATECALAVNKLIDLDSRDEGALLEVIESYFMDPDPSQMHEFDDDLEQDDGKKL